MRFLSLEKSGKAIKLHGLKALKNYTLKPHGFRALLNFLYYVRALFFINNAMELLFEFSLGENKFLASPLDGLGFLLNSCLLKV